ncbi:MAG: hypothetical protein WC138_11485 [Methanoculleus sp.]
MREEITNQTPQFIRIVQALRLLVIRRMVYQDDTGNCLPKVIGMNRLPVRDHMDVRREIKETTPVREGSKSRITVILWTAYPLIVLLLRIFYSIILILFFDPEGMNHRYASTVQIRSSKPPPELFPHDIEEGPYHSQRPAFPRDPRGIHPDHRSRYKPAYLLF